MILAGVAGVVAVVFVFRGDYEIAFVAAAGGAVCWILNYRWQLRESVARHDEEIEEDEDDGASS